MGEPVAPPGESPLDPSIADIDAVAFALERVQTMLNWIGEHHASFEALRSSNPKAAERELEFLKDAAQQARKHHGRLKDLILAGYSIDRAKRLPTDLVRTPKNQPDDTDSP